MGNANRRNTLTPFGLGEKILTVGDGGDYSTISEALDYISTQPGPSQITNSATCNFTQFSNFAVCTNPAANIFGDAAPGDWVYLENDDPAIDGLQYDWHYYRILSASDSHPAEAKVGLYLESGVLGSSKTSHACSIWRFPKYILRLSNGQFDPTGTVPDGYDITIQGSGKNTFVGEGNMYCPIYGRLHFDNLTINGNVTAADTRTQDGVNIQGGGFVAAEWTSLWVEGDASFSNSLFAQSQRMKNVRFSGVKGHRIYSMMFADYMEIDDVHFDSVTSMEAVEMFTNVR